MPTNKPRIMVTFTDTALYDLVMKDCEIQDRTDSGMILRIIKQHYMERRNEAELFSQNQQREARRRDGPAFETHPPPSLPRVSKLRENLG